MTGRCSTPFGTTNNSPGLKAITRLLNAPLSLLTRITVSSFQRSERLRCALVGMAGGEHKQATLSLAVQEHKPEIRGVFRLPSFGPLLLDGALERGVQIGAGIDGDAVERVPVEIPEDDVAGRFGMSERLWTGAWHRWIVASAEDWMEFIRE